MSRLTLLLLLILLILAAVQSWVNSSVITRLKVLERSAEIANAAKAFENLKEYPEGTTWVWGGEKLVTDRGPMGGMGLDPRRPGRQR